MIPEPTAADLALSPGENYHGKTIPFGLTLLDLVRAWIRRAVKLQAFKDWVHAYLDAQDVPHHPPGTHGAAGCRIGDRMDWLMNKLHTAERERDAERKDRLLLVKELERTEHIRSVINDPAMSDVKRVLELERERDEWKSKYAIIDQGLIDQINQVIQVAKDRDELRKLLQLAVKSVQHETHIAGPITIFETDADEQARMSRMAERCNKDCLACMIKAALAAKGVR